MCAEANLDDFWGMQECTLKFGSWTYDGNHIDLRFYKNAVDLDDFDKASPVKVWIKHFSTVPVGYSVWQC